MAQKKERVASVAGLVFKCIWIAFALLMFFSGMTIFLNTKSFGMWMAWGFFCAVPVIGKVIRDAVVEGRKGARRGANTYTASVDSTGVTVSNHPFREAIFSFIISVIGSLLLGPIYLGFTIIATIIDIIFDILLLNAMKKQKKLDTQENTDK